MEPRKTRTPTTVGIFGGDPVVGQALELLLEAAGYKARFLPEQVFDTGSETTADIGLLLLTPSPRSESVRSLLETLPATAKVPVLSLISVSADEPEASESTVLWPCPLAELKARINAALPVSGPAR